MKQRRPACSATGALLTRFAAQARQRPGSPAIISWETLTYADLDRRSDTLAADLVRFGVPPGMIVSVPTTRSASTIVAMLAVLKAGCGFLPLNAQLPAARRTWLSADAGAVLALDEAVAGRPTTEPGLVATPLGTAASGSAGAAPAYLMYTSGTTGRPRGVPVAQHHLLAMVDAAVATFGFHERDVWLQYNSLAFDFSIWEIWISLLTGGRLVLADPRAEVFPSALAALLRRENVTVLNLVPTVFRRLVRDGLTAGDLNRLRYLFVGGESFDARSHPIVRPLLRSQRPRLVNLYGLTESTVVISSHSLATEDLDRDADGTPIGRPLPHLGTAVVEPDDGRPCPPGTIGEICAWGASIVPGYRGDPVASAVRFQVLPGVGYPGARVLRTGDAGMVDPRSGSLIHLGRLDNQVKVHGIRVEPEGVEAVLRRLPGVVDALVTTVRGDAALEARVTLAAGVIWSPADIRTRLREELPAHEVPRHLSIVADLPRLASGKVDRRHLDGP